MTSATHKPLPRWSLAGALTACVLLAVGGVAYRQVSAVVDAELAREITLDPPLASLPMQLGSWRGEDVTLPEGVLRIAGNDDYVNRAYYDTERGAWVTLNVGYTARPRTILRHRPTICYPSAGWAREGEGERTLNVAGREIPVLMHRFRKTGLSDQRVVVLHFYVLDGKTTTDEYSFWGLRFRAPSTTRDTAHYVAQVQVVALVDIDPQATEETLLRFMRAAAPEILRLLPSGQAKAAASDDCPPILTEN